ncbi:histidine phosphatase family protein [Acinetobacter sichuanensis]|uniref:Histidine phosphatase family protein n=1 Tax=Acinetobacter sichuanensis TaxID=2136183 RepID=A0A371YUS5_9GAMM|nr:phosphoglycerate mutase family protein [Acinetobacter sichuanensis]RFC85221.1 phosphoglycerate mutase family protein [Acinetobacter sichuanensis]
MAIYLIRHAESVGNVDGQTESHASIALTELGHLQAQQLLAQLPKADHVIISPFLRTLQTAQPLLDRDQLTAEILPIEEFSYLSDVKCRGTTLSQRKPWVDAYWHLADVDYVDASDAESFRDLYQRVKALFTFLDREQQRYLDQNLMIFSHGQFLQLFQMLMTEPQAVSAELMQAFRHNMLHQPIKNTEFFIYK